jgi:hypothetical protein
MGNITFKLSRFNPRRKARGAEAASLIVLEDGEPVDCLWMSVRDIRENIKVFGNDEGLLAALEAYKEGKSV